MQPGHTSFRARRAPGDALNVGGEAGCGEHRDDATWCQANNDQMNSFCQRGRQRVLETRICDAEFINILALRLREGSIWAPKLEGKSCKREGGELCDDWVR